MSTEITEEQYEQACAELDALFFETVKRTLTPEESSRWDELCSLMETYENAEESREVHMPMDTRS